MAFLDTIFTSYIDEKISHKEFYGHIRRIALRVTDREDAASEVMIAVDRAINAVQKSIIFPPGSIR